MSEPLERGRIRGEILRNVESLLRSRGAEVARSAFDEGGSFWAIADELAAEMVKAEENARALLGAFRKG